MAAKDKGKTYSRKEGASASRAADAVISRLESQIVSGELESDRALPAERDLMKQFNASRTVIREAIATLSGRGLIESKPRFRRIVRKPGYTDVLTAVGHIITPMLSQQGGVKNIYEMRIFIERALVREAATSARRDDILELRESLSTNERAINDSEQFYATDMAFHGVLYRIPRNPILPALHHGIMSWLSPHWNKIPRTPDRNLVNYKSHEVIFRAIEARDPDAAEEALASHLKAAWQYVRVTFPDDNL